MKRNAQGASRLNQLKEAKKYSTEKGVPLAYALREMRMLKNGGPGDPPEKPNINPATGMLYPQVPQGLLNSNLKVENNQSTIPSVQDNTTSVVKPVDINQLEKIQRVNLIDDNLKKTAETTNPPTETQQMVMDAADATKKFMWQAAYPISAYKGEVTKDGPTNPSLIEMFNPIAGIVEAGRSGADIVRGQGDVTDYANMFAATLDVYGLGKLDDIAAASFRVKPNTTSKDAISWMKDMYNDEEYLNRINNIRNSRILFLISDDQISRVIERYKLPGTLDDYRNMTINEFHAAMSKAALDLYQPKNYFNFIKDEGLNLESIKSLLTTDGLSFGVPEKIYVSDLAKNKESIRVHELTHLIERNGDMFLTEDEKALLEPISLTYKEGISDKINKAMSFGPEYFTKPTEIHARMNQARFDLGLTWKDKFTEEMFDELMKKNNFYGMGKFIGDKKKFVNLMNTFYSSAAAVGVNEILNNQGKVNSNQEANRLTMQYGGNINSPFVKMLFNGGPTNPGGPGDPPIPQVKKKTEEKPKINAATGMLEPSVPNLKPVSTYQPSKPKQPTESLDVRSNTAKQLSSLVIDFKTDKKKVDEINKQFHKIYWAPNTKRNCTAGALNCNTDYISKNLPNVNPIRKMIEENGNYQNYLIPQNVIKGRTDLTAVNQSIDAWEMSNYLTSENLGSYIYNNPENTNVDDKFLEGIDLSKVTIGTLIGQGDARGVYVPNLESGTPRHLFTVAAFDVDGMPLIYDGGKMVRLDSPNVLGTSMPILSMVVPKGYESYTFDNVSKQLKSKTTKLNDEPEFTPSLDLKGKEIAPQIENVYKSALSVRDQVSVEYDIPTSVLNQFINALPGIANEESKINNYNGFSPRTFFGDVPLMNAVGKPLVKVAKNVAMSIPNSYRPEGVQDYVLEMQAYDRYGRNDKEREAYFNKLKEQNQFSDYPYENLKSSVGPFAIKDFPEYATQAYGIRRFDLYGTTVSNDAQLTKGSKVALILLAEKFNNLKKQYPNLTEEQLVDLSIVNYNNVSKSNDPNFVDFYIVNKKLPDRYLNAVKSFKL